MLRMKAMGHAAPYATVADARKTAMESFIF
jgi:hypothetical protein